VSGLKTQEREQRALWDAMDELSLKSGIILNRGEEKIVEKDGKEIHYIPLWKWLLEK
jgi:predicted AAA+ superfamily ATPase